MRVGEDTPWKAIMRYDHAWVDVDWMTGVTWRHSPRRKLKQKWHQLLRLLGFRKCLT